jgi:hypothetical protein
MLDMPPAEQEQMLAQLRAARYGHLSASHILLLCALPVVPRPRAPSRSCGSRPSVYRTPHAYRHGTLDVRLGRDTGASAPHAPV